VQALPIPYFVVKNGVSGIIFKKNFAGWAKWHNLAANLKTSK